MGRDVVGSPSEPASRLRRKFRASADWRQLWRRPIRIRQHAPSPLFADPDAYNVADPAHPERLLIVGYSFDRLLTVVYAVKDPAGLLRIISARRASPTERKFYEEGP